jgi:hypothetical protein
VLDLLQIPIEDGEDEPAGRHANAVPTTATAAAPRIATA